MYVSYGLLPAGSKPYIYAKPLIPKQGTVYYHLLVNRPLFGD